MLCRLTGTIEHVIHHGERTVPLPSIVGSISGSQASIRSLNNAASTLTVDERLNSDDQFLISAVKFDKHIATTDLVTEPKPTSSLISIVSNVKIN